ncbi:hypothetical protein Zmor_024745 [Zophobas morio]|uniref:Uncharacterized protein n=1 Tax=Zophobas morio TaxID=2755281 RepID=A0AA38HZJ6_9CUCU|nr:hypothetical protein Zmor_024745 [Zophobas morio]
MGKTEPRDDGSICHQYGLRPRAAGWSSGGASVGMMACKSAAARRYPLTYLTPFGMDGEWKRGRTLNHRTCDRTILSATQRTIWRNSRAMARLRAEAFLELSRSFAEARTCAFHASGAISGKREVIGELCLLFGLQIFDIDVHQTKRRIT